MNDDLISRSWLLEQYGLKDCTKYGNETAEQKKKSYDTMMMYEIAEMIKDAPTIYYLDNVKEALQEIQQYRAIGTIEEIKEILQIINEGQDDVDESGISTGLLHVLLEYAVYKKIGTVEECREAREYLNKMNYNGGWIACEDRLPDKIGKYIIHVITGTGEDYVGMWLYERGHHLSGRQYWIDDKQGYWASHYNGDPINEPLSKNVMAWQPLPEPYHK